MARGANEDDTAMTTRTTMTSCDEGLCQVCHCTDEGCDGTVCHGLDAD